MGRAPVIALIEKRTRWCRLSSRRSVGAFAGVAIGVRNCIRLAHALQNALRPRRSRASFSMHFKAKLRRVHDAATRRRVTHTATGCNEHSLLEVSGERTRLILLCIRSPLALLTNDDIYNRSTHVDFVTLLNWQRPPDPGLFDICYHNPAILNEG